MTPLADPPDIAADLSWLAQQPAGRRIIAHWLRAAGVFGPAQPTAEQALYWEGRRSLGYELLFSIQNCAPAFLPLALSECLGDPGLDGSSRRRDGGGGG